MSAPLTTPFKPTGRRWWMWLLPMAVIALLLLIAVVSSACGGAFGSHGAMHEAMHGGGDRPAQTPVVSKEALVSVEIRDFDFSPRYLTIRTGSSVTWTNYDAAPHDAADVAGSWSTPILRKGETSTVSFDSPGSYEYLCTIHPAMKGTLVVE
jgi:plastocyanin